MDFQVGIVAPEEINYTEKDKLRQKTKIDFMPLERPSMYWLRIALFSILDSEDSSSNNYIIAKFILENYNSLSGVSLTEISRKCNLSKAAVSRFCKDLGLMDYIDLQMLIRASGQDDLSSAAFTDTLQKEEFFGQLDLTLKSLKSAADNPVVEELIADLKKSRSVSAFGHLQASHIAYILGNNLGMNDIFCFCTQSWTEQIQKLQEAGPDDLFVIFSASGEYFKRMDMNMHFLDKEKAPKIYMVTFADSKVQMHRKIKKIIIGGHNQWLQANAAMNMFANYISYRLRAV